MKSLTLPNNVAVLLKRLVNVVSTLSISNHYFCHHHVQRDSKDRIHGYRLQDIGTPSDGPGNWSFPETSYRDAFAKRWDGVKDKAEYVVRTSSISLPWWPSVLSASTTPSSPIMNTPEKPPDHKHERHQSSRPPADEPPESPPKDIIHQLLVNPALCDPLRTPRFPIVLCHGLYGFDARGPSTFPSLRMHYWANVLNILRGKLGAEVIITSVPGTGNIASRSARLHQQLKEKAYGRGVNFLAHSMGGLDCRHLITHIKPSEYVPLSLMSVSTPHRGSPFMDWCMEHIGIGKLGEQERELLLNRTPEAHICPAHTTHDKAKAASSTSKHSFNFASLPSSFTTLLLSTVDEPAYSNLSSTYLNDVFNPATPDDPKVKYWSVAGRSRSLAILHPLWFTKIIVDSAEEEQRLQMMQEQIGPHGYTEHEPLGKLPIWADEQEWGNDGLVTVQSAKWGEYLGVLEGADHWDMRGARGIEFGVDLPAIPAIGLGVTLNSVASTTLSKAESASTNEWSKFLTGWKSKEKAPNPSEQSDALKVDTELLESTPQTPEEREAEREAERIQREVDYRDGDHVVRTSTERLSVVFDWLVDQIPSTEIITTAQKALTQPDSTSKANDDAKAMKALADSMIAHTVAPTSASSSSSEQDNGRMLPRSPNPEVLRAEVKKMMERERETWTKKELESKADLERFFVALSRKMWDEGL